MRRNEWEIKRNKKERKKEISIASICSIVSGTASNVYKFVRGKYSRRDILFLLVQVYTQSVYTFVEHLERDSRETKGKVVRHFDRIF